MKVKKYYASDMREGFQRIKREFGPEALILHSRKVRRRGLRGFFTPPQMEIMVAFDEASAAAVQGTEVAPGGQVMEEISNLKFLVHRLVLQNTAGGNEGENADIIFWKKHLREHDLAPALLEEIFAEIRIKLQGEVNLTREILALVLQKKVASRLKICREQPNRVQIFVGPTGVGKTTTLAKLAAYYTIHQREKVGLITIDHYRIAAVEQLRTYAEIVDLPLEVVMSPRDVGEAIRRLQHCERILVDTAGRGTGNVIQINELGNYLACINCFNQADILLTMSATTRWQDIRLVAESFKKLNYNRLVVTKLDETKSYGAVLNGVFASGVPLTYLTDGQNVPDDLKFPSDIDIPSMMIGGSD